MRHALFVLALGAMASSVGGCVVASFFVPITRTPADHAHDLDKKCATFTDPGAVSLLVQDSALDSVEASFSHVVDPPAEHLRGAKINVRPGPGISKESLTRALECHQASVVLGKSRTQENDPFVLPERWVDIDVDSEGDAFVILVRVDAFKDAQVVLARAKSYLASVRRAVPLASPVPPSPASLPAPAAVAPPAPPPATVAPPQPSPVAPVAPVAPSTPAASPSAVPSARDAT
jgi:hypothetical protein